MGPGLVVGNELRESIRSHHDIEWDMVQHFNHATKVLGLNQRELVAVDLIDHIAFSRIVLLRICQICFQ